MLNKNFSSTINPIFNALIILLDATPGEAEAEGASGSEAVAAYVPCDMNGDWSEIFESPL